MNNQTFNEPSLHQMFGSLSPPTKDQFLNLIDGDNLQTCVAASGGEKWSLDSLQRSLKDPFKMKIKRLSVF